MRVMRTYEEKTMKIAGLDIGTTGCKITVFDETGQQLGKEYADYSAHYAHSVHEVDPDSLKNSIFDVITKAAERWKDIGGIGITSFGESFVAVDVNGIPLFPILLYTDPRGEEECEELVLRSDTSFLTRTTGLAPHPMYSLPKIMYLKRHCPVLFSRVSHIFLIGDYVGWLLTGKAQIDYSLATRSMAFDIRSLCWSTEILDLAGLDASLLSEVVPTGTCIGTISQEACRRTGLSPDVQVVCVSHDQIAAAIGAGASKSNIAVDGAGTVECITPVFSEIPSNPLYWTDKYNVVPYLGQYAAYAFSYAGGALLHWCTETFCRYEKELAARKGLDIHQYLQSGDYSPTGLLVLPHFAGAATPYMDTGSKGAILGLDLSTPVREIYLACLEGVAYEMRVNMEHLAEAGVAFDRLVATGGGAKSSKISRFCGAIGHNLEFVYCIKCVCGTRFYVL